QASRITRRQDRALLEGPHMIEQLQHFFAAEDLWQFLWLLAGRDDLLEHPIPLEGYLVEEADSSDGDQYRDWRQVLFIGEVDLIGTNIFRSEILRRLAEVPRKLRDLLTVRGLGV